MFAFDLVDAVLNNELLRKEFQNQYMDSDALLLVNDGGAETDKIPEPAKTEIEFPQCTIKERKRSSCDKKIVRKEWLESLVVSETVKNILQPEKIVTIAKRCAALSAIDTSQNDKLKYLQK